MLALLATNMTVPLRHTVYDLKELLETRNALHCMIVSALEVPE